MGLKKPRKELVFFYPVSVILISIISTMDCVLSMCYYCTKKSFHTHSIIKYPQVPDISYLFLFYS